MSDNCIRIGFGGGCHWCTEAVFQALRGVHSVEQGFIRSKPPFDGWSEAVIVTFDPAIIDLATLTEVHLRTHASTSAHAMRGKYRSAVYVFDGAQTRQARDLIDGFQPAFGGALVTQVLPFSAFKPSDARFHDYYASDPDRPFCQAYIDPKLALLRRDFARHVTSSAPAETA
jgi:peptide-methionine (S)-S-oxide reductase